MDSNKIIRSRLCHGDHVPASRHQVRARKHMHTDKHTHTHTHTQLEPDILATLDTLNSSRKPDKSVVLEIYDLGHKDFHYATKSKIHIKKHLQTSDQ